MPGESGVPSSTLPVARGRNEEVRIQECALFNLKPGLSEYLYAAILLAFPNWDTCISSSRYIGLKCARVVHTVNVLHLQLLYIYILLCKRSSPQFIAFLETHFKGQQAVMLPRPPQE